MSEVEIYAKDHLAKEVQAVETTDRKNQCPQLNTFGKAVIYKYSDDGFRKINAALRKSRGKTVGEFADHLTNALNRLSDYEGLVYRKVHLTKAQSDRYKNALKNNRPVKEYPFVSTTKSRLIAMNFEGTTSQKPNCLFRIQTKTGKEIEKIAKFDEKEVLIRSNTRFIVLEVSKESDDTLITMEEI